ncbi:MAG: M18 family aminopeptidase [Gammaproteobacteria bacterium]|jgi:aspartyl aminopeptidase|nr:M18 family aminopeptidase [Gammaproteobacteria bacterium]
MSKQKELNAGLCDFIQASPTPFHAVENLSKELIKAGYNLLHESDAWHIEPGQGYFVCRNSSSLIAFRTGDGNLQDSGFKIVGAHSDSPCLKVKPQAALVNKGYAQCGVEVYGGVLLNPWFDRDLSLAGRVHYKHKSGDVAPCLIDFEKAIASIPSLAIHLDREANSKRSIDKQKHLAPVLLQTSNNNDFDFNALLLNFLHENLGLIDAEKILSYELSFYDNQKATVIGMKEEFIASARLDNLLSCYLGLQSLIASNNDQPALLVCSDHEEVGSVSAAGAAGSFLEAVIERVTESLASEASGKQQEAKRRLLENSILISVDNAHGIHPNYPEKHDQQHGPILNQGPVLKINANQGYASNSETSALLESLCAEINVPLQSFVVRSDMACGSTVGPIIAAELGLKTVDLGVPTLAMHSIRELAGSKDTEFLLQVLTAFFSKS